MNTFVHTGKRVPYANTGSAIDSGDVVVLASGATGHIGIAVADIAATTGTGELETEGVHELPKNAGEAFTLGQLVYWDGTETTGTASGATRAGRVYEVAASAATTAKIKINQA